jgi:hypothetical protein
VMCFCAFYFGECLEYIRLCMSVPASFYIFGIPSLIFFFLSLDCAICADFEKCKGGFLALST